MPRPSRASRQPWHSIGAIQLRGFGQLTFLRPQSVTCARGQQACTWPSPVKSTTRVTSIFISHSLVGLEPDQYAEGCVQPPGVLRHRPVPVDHHGHACRLQCLQVALDRVGDPPQLTALLEEPSDRVASSPVGPAVYTWRGGGGQTDPVARPPARSTRGGPTTWRRVCALSRC